MGNGKGAGLVRRYKAVIINFPSFLSSKDEPQPARTQPMKEMWCEENRSGGISKVGSYWSLHGTEL